MTTLKISECSELKYQNPSAVRKSFAVHFEGPATMPLEQGVHWIRHASLGNIGIFIVPIAQRGNCRIYEAIFN